MSTHMIKVVVLGNTAVGKTSIAQRFTSGTFSETEPTIMASMKSKEVQIEGSNDVMQIKVWDTAGQEKYRSLASGYYRDAQAAILVYDCTNPDSFKAIDQWIIELKDNCKDDIVIVIAGNKCDKTEDEKVRFEDASAYAEAIHALFFSVSAKDNIGIDRMFLAICAELKPEYKQFYIASNQQHSTAVNPDCDTVDAC